ncbi:uncharacterized protein METZ01_LOCUS315407, partial [marine metagenome]
MWFFNFNSGPSHQWVGHDFVQYPAGQGLQEIIAT